MSRWDHSAIDQLPTYMKGFYLKLINNFEELKNELEPEEKYRVSYLIDQVCFLII